MNIMKKEYKYNDDAYVYKRRPYLNTVISVLAILQLCVYIFYPPQTTSNITFLVFVVAVFIRKPILTRSLGHEGIVISRSGITMQEHSFGELDTMVMPWMDIETCCIDYSWWSGRPIFKVRLRNGVTNSLCFSWFYNVDFYDDVVRYYSGSNKFDYKRSKKIQSYIRACQVYVIGCFAYSIVMILIEILRK